MSEKGTLRALTAPAASVRSLGFLETTLSDFKLIMDFSFIVLIWVPSAEIST